MYDIFYISPIYWRNMRYTFLLVFLTGCADAIRPLREYIITCPIVMNEPPIVDTIVTNAHLRYLRTSYRIADRYYPSTCIIKTRVLDENH